MYFLQYRVVPQSSQSDAPPDIAGAFVNCWINRLTPEETFQSFANRHDAEALRSLFNLKISAAA